MTRETLQIPAARSWRDIPQPAVPRAMSREGRWRLIMSSLRVTGLIVVIAGLGWCAWVIAGSLTSGPAMTDAVKAVPMKAPELRTDGVLDDAWLAQALALPKNVSLMDLDLSKLRDRLLADQQLVTATLTRHFPDRLVVQISERAPVARVKTEMGGQQHVFLVARDGVIFDGKRYDAAMLGTLPWLDGIEIAAQRGGFRPIEGMGAVADLLAKARLEAEHLYTSWAIVSLAHLESDHQIEVRTTRGPCTVVFSTRDDFFRQLSKLSYIWDQLSRMPEAKATIDLSLGSDVPVMVEAAPEPAGTEPAPGVKAKDGRPSRPMRSAATPALRAGQTRFLAGQQSSMRPSVSALFTSHPQPTPSHREF